MWRVALGMLAGGGCVLLAPRLPSMSTCALVAAFICAVALWRRWWPLAAFGFGALHCAWAVQSQLDDRLAPALEGQALEVRGSVVSVPQGTLEALRFRFAPEPVEGRAPLPRMVELTWYDAPRRVDAAERLVLEVKLRRPRGFVNPGGSDNEARMLRDRVGASGYVREGRSLGRPSDAWLRHPVLLARARVAADIRTMLGDRPASGIVAGLAVGLQDALSREQWLALSRSGTSHLMAISGLHIAMVAAIVAWTAARIQGIRQRWRGALGPRRDAAVVAGCVAALLYSLLAGWSVPTQRTMVMIGVGSLAWLLRRRVGVADGLAVCVIGVLLLDPLAPLATGFWLSFGAVVAILYAATGYVSRGHWCREYLRVQAVVTLGLTPVLAGSFGAVSLVSVCVNLYAIPLYTLVVVPAVLVSCATAFAWPALGARLMEVTAKLIELTWPLIDVPAGWSLATWSIAGLGTVAWGAMLLGAVAALSPLPRCGRLAGVALVATACVWRPAVLAPGTARLTVLDVGQGLAVVVETRNHALVYDTGPSFRSGNDAGRLVVVPFLAHRGIRAVDRLVVSHDDDDHKGGAASVLGLLAVTDLVTGPGVHVDSQAGSSQRHDCRRGGRWTWDGVTFEWLHPGPGPYERDNDRSCVLLVQAGGRAALLTGDVERAAEAEILAAARPMAVDVVVAPHHGSRTSSTAAFVAATHPAWVVFSVGHRNRWNQPAGEIVERWERAGARGLRTSTSGATSFLLGPGAPPDPQEWRLRRPRVWRDP